MGLEALSSIIADSVVKSSLQTMLFLRVYDIEVVYDGLEDC